jgi:hypothetical protein
MAQPFQPSPSIHHDALRTPVAPAAPAAPRPSIDSGGAALTLDQALEEQRLSRLGTEVLRQVIAHGTPSVTVLARYLRIDVDELLCCAEGVRRLPEAARRPLARVALAFAPGEIRHTARRLLEGEMARVASR